VAVYPNHLEHVPTVAERVPNLRMVIDHLAKPPIRSGEMGEWRGQMKQAAASPQVYAKVSGLNTAADWTSWSHRDLIPYVDAAVELFGPERLMFGSDWPVATLAGTYRQVWNETMMVVKRYGGRAQDFIFGETACRFYGLGA
jgi:L-fuconolactonase